MGRRSERQRARRGHLDRCIYCGNQNPAELRPSAVTPAMPVCKDVGACTRRAAQLDRAP